MKPQEFFATSTERHGITCAQLEIETIWFLEKLPPVHRDPFDRILIAHALRHGMTLVTPDPNVAKYPVPVVW
jgi:PIN domain nuclease of toxin-antitoxin system